MDESSDSDVSDYSSCDEDADEKAMIETRKKTRTLMRRKGEVPGKRRETQNGQIEFDIMKHDDIENAFVDENRKSLIMYRK